MVKLLVRIIKIFKSWKLISDPGREGSLELVSKLRLDEF